MLTEGDHEGIEARILRSNGTPFPEHRIEHTPGRPGCPPTTTCWLEIEQGQTFTIETKLYASILNRYHGGHWRYKARIDGSVIERTIGANIDPTVCTHIVSKMTYKERGRLLSGDLKFFKLTTTEYPTGANRSIVNDEDCSIQVEVEAGTSGASDSLKGSGAHVTTGPSGGVVHEKDAKMIGSAVSAVNAKPAIPHKRCHWEKLDEQNPYHCFTFKYRTRPILEVLRVVEPERAPTPTPSPPPIRSRQKRKRSNDPEGEGIGDDTQKLMLAAILDMRREVSGLRKTVKELRQDKAKEKSQMHDLTGGDSE